jgi:CRISPR/Cas system Type II protein with McrA/HNH and RuvC-like nuclease domain
MSTAEQKAKAAERWKAYYAIHKDRLVLAAKQRRENNPEAIREAKRKYYTSEKGKAQKRKEDEAYIASGGRAETEKRRAAKPVSEVRKLARLKYQLMRSSSEKMLEEFDSFVLSEAVRLCKLRTRQTGKPWHVDHIVPVSKGGVSSADNLQVVPARWNRQKSNKHSERFFAHA